MQTLISNAYYVQDVNDVLTAIDHVIDMGLCDPSKIAVVGGSHGGFLTSHLIGQVQLLCESVTFGVRSFGIMPTFFCWTFFLYLLFL